MSKKLSDLCDVFTDGDWIESKDQSDEGIRLIQTGNIGIGKYLDKANKAKYISEETFKCLKCTEVFPGDILVSRLPDPIGRACIVPQSNEKMITAVDCTICRTKTDLILKEYLCYYMQSKAYYKKLFNNVTGTTRKRISRKNLGNIEIDIHTKIEQEKIIKKLDLLSSIIENRTKEVSYFDNLVKARFVEMFGSVEKKIPLSTLCDVSGGYSFKSGDITSDGAVKILQIGNVYLDDISWETTNYLPKGYDETYSRFLLNKGDIVVALTRPIIQSLGNVKACIVRDLDLPCLLNQRVGRIVPRNNKEVSNLFIYGCLMTCDFTRYVKSCCIGCSQPNISLNDIGNYMIPDVSFNEQMMFVNFKEQIDKSKFSIVNGEYISPVVEFQRGVYDRK